MPVFHRVQDDVLVVTVDGDFTAGELARKGGEALESQEETLRRGVLLDVSGAAGAADMDVLELARVFVDHPTQVSRIAVLGTDHDTVSGGVAIRGFYRRAEALAWLGGGE